MKVVIVTPAPSGSRAGNRVTALRWEGILRELGCDVTIAESWDGGPCDVLVALHAKRSHESIVRLKRTSPRSLLVVALTGTDLYQDLAQSDEARESLDLADRLVVLQAAARDALPASVRGKVAVIVQSAARVAARGTPDPGIFEVCVIGHLREVKDPFRAAEAARRLPRGSRVVVTHVGAALEDGMEARARAEEAANPRYRWLGERSREETLAILAGSRLMALTSRLEGGANVLSEAIVARVPVVASRIDGSVGILGADYPGFFPCGETNALAALLRRAETDPAFLAELARRCAEIEPRFSRERERSAWDELLRAAAPAAAPRPVLIETGVDASWREAFARDVREGLSEPRKRLPCRWFYDREGSLLFEEICTLARYEIPRAEIGILRGAADEIAAATDPATTLVELGCGDASKTRWLIEAFFRRRPELGYVAIDVSRAALEEGAEGLTRDYPGLGVTCVHAEYEAGLRWLEAARLRPMLLLWLGSNIGNFDRAGAVRFVRSLRALLGAEDRLLVGIDLRKPKAQVEAAYDDARGVTARFNKNLLARINRDLGGRFDLDLFRHRALYDEESGRVEMHLVSTADQSVTIDGAGFTASFRKGEPIHTEDSYKYSAKEIADLAEQAGLRVERMWTDARVGFCDVLLSRRDP